ncbi:MAG: response regulator [Verrucomicrobiota bacterium]
MKKILIVDDSVIIRRSIERLLEQEGAEIRMAQNGVTALQIFRDFQPGYVTMDLTMPEMDGLSCIKEILNLAPETRILVVSALADKATAIEALKRGAHAFVLKPFTSDKLREAFDDLVDASDS